MKPSEIITEKSNEIPTVRKELRKIADLYEVDCKTTKENVICIPSKNFLLRVEKFYMDFGKGKECANITIQTPEYSMHNMTVEDISVSDIMLRFSNSDGEKLKVLP